ncbi:MAG: nuclear transport factor 2 family protein, partial [Hyphomicrobiales bacterium]|nr:nuclear transport factor 2 family protein [Hyphomicrobiales bacterium]
MGDLADTMAQIMQLHARYCDAIVREDAAAFGDCFTDEAEWRISGKILRGREEIEAIIERTFTNATRVYIECGTPMIDISPSGQISARTYMNERCAWKDGATNIVVGRYYERFVPDGQRLKIAWRLWQGLYTGPA